MQRQVRVNLGNLLLSLSEITDYANPIISQHQQRTAFIAIEIAKNWNVDSELLGPIFAAALLHDIGAISVEEKTQVHESEVSDFSIHCIKSSALLQRTTLFKGISDVVKYHHKRWDLWDETMSDFTVLASQIILLADTIERAIDRNKYILHQSNEIVENINTHIDGTINKELIKCFNEISRREEFWLDIVSSKLTNLLTHTGPYCRVEIGMGEIDEIAELFRDIIDFKSPFTATHTTGVSACAEKIAEIFGFTESELRLIKIAGNFHDIGKLVIPNKILEKPGKLTKEEFAIMKSHTYYTYYAIHSISGLRQVAEWAAYHHEKLDGNGYPFKCKPQEIDNGSRIMTVADIFTAISEDRPYRKGMSKQEIYRIFNNLVINKCVDKKIVDLLFDNYDNIQTMVKQKQSIAREYYQNRFINYRSMNTKQYS